MRQSKLLLTAVLLVFLGLTVFGQASITVNPGTNVTIGTGTTLDVGGQKLLLMDDYSSAPSFLQYGNLTFSGGGEAFVEQYLTRDVFHMVSEPVNNEVIEVYQWKYLEQFNENDGTWTFLNLPLTTPLNVGEGYFVYSYTTDPNGQWPSSGDSVVFNGNLNYQDVILTLSNTDASPTSGWNLIGNPFPVAIEWNNNPDWNLNNVGASMYIYDPDGGGNYVVWNTTSGGTNPNGGFIAATQGFWVRTADTVGGAASLTIPASQRYHNAATFFKSSGPVIPNQLLLTVEGNNQTDKTVIGFYDKATAEFDPQYDGVYYKAPGGALSLYSVTYGEKYALNELPSAEDYPVVSLNFEPTATGKYTLKSEWLESIPEEIPVYLEDKQNKVIRDLRTQPDYTFSATKSDKADRFNIWFTEPGISENLLSYIHIYSYAKTVYLEIPVSLNGEITIYDITGKKIVSRKATAGRNEIKLRQPNGNYIVRVVADEGTISKKVYIN